MTYKIVHREFGQYPYWPDTEEEAEEFCDFMRAIDLPNLKQYYTRRMIEYGDCQENASMP